MVIQGGTLRTAEMQIAESASTRLCGNSIPFKNVGDLRTDLDRQPDVIGTSPSLRIPAISHINVRGLLTAFDGELKRVLGVVCFLAGRGNICAVGPRS